MSIAMIRVGKGKRRIRFYLYSEDKKQKTNKRGRETIIHLISKIIEKEVKYHSSQTSSRNLITT